MTSKPLGDPVRPAGAGSRLRLQLDFSAKLVIFIFVAVSLSGLISSIAAGPSGQPRVASFSLTAIIAVFIGFVSWTLIAAHRRVPSSVGRSLAIFVAFVLACGCSAVFGGTVTRQGIQYLTVFMAAVGAMALSAIVRARFGKAFDQLIAKCMRVTSIVLIASFLVKAAGAHLAVAPQVSAIVALINIGWFLAEYRVHHKNAIWWALALLIAIAVSLSRTALAAGSIVFFVTMIIAPQRYRIRGLIVAGLIVSAGIWAITSWAPLHNEILHRGSKSLSWRRQRKCKRAHRGVACPMVRSPESLAFRSWTRSSVSAVIRN